MESSKVLKKIVNTEWSAQLSHTKYSENLREVYNGIYNQFECTLNADTPSSQN